ncbi:flavin reductase family protein [Aerococcaceae bacterium DSM 111176]|nr:flavin reductase family protein [Aerococcaceae bacterium DSM 111176]
MQNFTPNDLTERENYKFLIGSIIPRPIALISTLNEDGTINIGPFSYFNIVSSNPPLLSVAIQRKGGIMKDTARNLRRTGEGVIHIVDRQNYLNANQTAASLEYGDSELSKTSFSLVDSVSVATPALNEAQVRFEVKVNQIVDIENKGDITADLVLFNIERYHIASDIYQDGKIDPRGLDAMSRLAGHDYGDIGEITTVPRPE